MKNTDWELICIYLQLSQSQKGKESTLDPFSYLLRLVERRENVIPGRNT